MGDGAAGFSMLAAAVCDVLAAASKVAAAGVAAVVELPADFALLLANVSWRETFCSPTKDAASAASASTNAVEIKSFDACGSTAVAATGSETVIEPAANSGWVFGTAGMGGGAISAPLAAGSEASLSIAVGSVVVCWSSGEEDCASNFAISSEVVGTVSGAGFGVLASGSAAIDRAMMTPSDRAPVRRPGVILSTGAPWTPAFSASAILLENRPASTASAPRAAADGPVGTGAAGANRAEAVDMEAQRLSWGATTAPAAPKSSPPSTQRPGQENNSAKTMQSLPSRGVSPKGGGRYCRALATFCPASRRCRSATGGMSSSDWPDLCASFPS